MEMNELEARVRGLEETIAGLRQAVEDLQGRVQVTEDINEIKEVQWTYLNALMATDWDTCANCFAEDALVDVYLHDPVRGRESIRHWFEEELSQTHSGKEGDVCIHPIITVNGDTAKGNWLLYMMYFYARTGQSMFWVQGYYDNEYVREDGRWKISVMRWHETIGLPGGGPPTGLW
jgi:ketosteroid isomerase-like protein